MPRNPAVAGIASAVPVLADARRTHADARKATASAVAASPRTAGNPASASPAQWVGEALSIQSRSERVKYP